MYIEDKENFVKEFGELLARYGVEDVLELHYTQVITDSWDTEEYVKIIFTNGYEQVVNVHMDSLGAIVKDIMKCLMD